MKKFILIVMLLLITMQAQGTFTAQNYLDKKTYLGSGNKLLDPLYLHIVDAQSADTVGKPFFYYIPGTAPATVEGYLYYSATLDALVLRTASEWVTLEAGGDFASLDEAYNGGNAIDVDGSAVTLTVSLGDNNAGLVVAQNDSTNDPDAMNITSAADASTAVGLQIDCTAGFDVQGTGDSWSISIAGVLDAESFTGVTNSQIINFDTNNEIEFEDNSEDVSFNFATSNTLSLTTDSLLDSFAFGVIDDLEGVGTIVFDDAASTITLTSTGATDLTIAQATADQDASLILTSSGVGTDALSLSTSGAAGDIKIASVDNIDIDAADDITINTAGGSIVTTLVGGDFDVDATDAAIWLDSGEATDNAFDFDAAAGGFDLDVALSITLTTTESESDSVNIDSAGGVDIDIAGGGAGEDFSVTTDTSITLTATENHASNTHIEENGGTSGGINIFANQGTGVSATTEHDASVQLHSDDGGIGLYSTANLGDTIRIETNGGTDENIFIQAIKGTGADSITLTSTVGGIAITANAASKDVDINSVAGSITIEAEIDAASAVSIVADGGNTTTILIHADTGTAVAENGAAIQLLADDGGISIQSDANLDDAVTIRADGGTSAEITIHNDRGTNTDSIEVISDDGGIVLTAGKPVVVTNAFELAYVLVPDGAAYDVLAANSGHVHLIPDQGADITLDLPTEATGLRFKFVYVGGAADAQDWLIDSESNTNYYIGGVVQHDPDAGGDDTTPYYSDGNSNSILGVLTPECGTEIEIWCNGIQWFVTGTVISATDTGVTFSD